MTKLPVVWHEAYEVDIGEHVYPTEKYRLVRDRLREEGLLETSRVLRPEPSSWEDLARVHDARYLEKVRAGRFSRRDELRLEVPFSPELRRAMRLAAGGTTLAAREALEAGVAVHLGGGFHHAFADHGEGFCLLNDAAVALRRLLDAGRIERAVVVDCDVHQGNGTAAIFRDDSRVFTLSLHQRRLYPARKPPSDLDIGLRDGLGDEGYLERLRSALPRALRGEPAPDLALYLAGADPYRGDQLGGLALSLRGLRRRDRTVLRELRRRGIPGAVLLAGGYASRLEDTVSIHAATAREAARAAGSSGRFREPAAGDRPGEDREEGGSEARRTPGDRGGRGGG